MRLNQPPPRILDRADLKAEHAVCQHLVRACRQAMYEMALDQETDAEVRRRAIQILKEIHSDWQEAQKALRREMAQGRPTFTAR